MARVGGVGLCNTLVVTVGAEARVTLASESRTGVHCRIWLCATIGIAGSRSAAHTAVVVVVGVVAEVVLVAPDVARIARQKAVIRAASDAVVTIRVDRAGLDDSSIQVGGVVRVFDRYKVVDGRGSGAVLTTAGKTKNSQEKRLASELEDLIVGVTSRNDHLVVAACLGASVIIAGACASGVGARGRSKHSRAGGSEGARTQTGVGPVSGPGVWRCVSEVFIELRIPNSTRVVWCFFDSEGHGKRCVYGVSALVSQCKGNGQLKEIADIRGCQVDWEVDVHEQSNRKPGIEGNGLDIVTRKNQTGNHSSGVARRPGKVVLVAKTTLVGSSRQGCWGSERSNAVRVILKNGSDILPGFAVGPRVASPIRARSLSLRTAVC